MYGEVRHLQITEDRECVSEDVSLMLQEVDWLILLNKADTAGYIEIRDILLKEDSCDSKMPTQSC
jgi:hypothetical protein